MKNNSNYDQMSFLIKMKVLANVSDEKMSCTSIILVSRINFAKTVPILLSLPYVHVDQCLSYSPVKNAQIFVLN